VFTTNGTAPISGFAKFKVTFDRLMLEQLAAGRGDDQANVTLDRWTIHDLRRTARSLMTRAGIEPDHAERALGHKIAGVRGVYDRHHFRDEKRQAFEALAAQLDRIVSPQPNVIAFTASAR
jgi:integrase